MNKISLRNIYLLNWYGFVDVTIPVSDDLTLISGENECGKSTILDAVKYAYTGDTQFNKATSGYNTGVGKRNLISYTRCLTDASAGIYARPADRIPVVYSHIALEYYDQVNENSFVLGVIIETAVTDIRGTFWYAADKKKIKDLSFIYKEKEIKKPYDSDGFGKANHVQVKNKKEGITLFMQMTGLRVPYREVPKYQRKLRSIMAYNPAAKIQEFIKESVLEEHDVSFDKLRDAKKNIEQINQSLEQINQEVNDLDAILKGYVERDKSAFKLKCDDIKIKYQAVIEFGLKSGEAEETISTDKIKCELLEKKIKEQVSVISKNEEQFMEARNTLREMDVSKAISDSEQQIKILEQKLDELEREKKRLEHFQVQMQDVLSKFSELHVEFQEAGTVNDLTSAETDETDKKRCIEDLRQTIVSARDDLIKTSAVQKRELDDIQGQLIQQNEIVDNCNRNRNNYQDAREQLSLIAEINRDFQKRGIADEAHMACEYVAGLQDEEWRDTLEAFLGIHRYAVIVLPSSFAVANAVMDSSSHHYIELVNSPRLMSRKPDCEEDSVFHQLIIKNDVAANYFMFWLGRIHGVSLSDVPKFDNAMSKEGKLSRNMAITYINKNKIRSYCLGLEAIELNRISAEKKIKNLEQQEKEIVVKQQADHEQAEFLRKSQNLFADFDLNSFKEANQVSAKLSDERGRYKKLYDAQKNNSEFMALSQRVSELERQLTGIKKEHLDMVNEKAGKEAEISSLHERFVEYSAKEKNMKQQIDDERVLSSNAVDTAIAEYDAFSSGTNKSGGVLSVETKKRIDRRVRELDSIIVTQEQNYNNRKQEADKLPIGLDHEADYQKRRGKIWIDDLQGIQQKLKDQTARYERIFKREFVLNIYETAKAARSDIADINKELRKLQFSTKYQFDVRPLSDSSDYAKILMYAEYLQDTNNMEDGQMSMTGIMGYENDEVETREKEIKEIINRIIEKNDIVEVSKFADYRNYMNYEIIINNDEVKDGKLSKQVGYNSGAGTQIPYTLILSAALSMLYNARVNSVRLIFIDEPFEKMSDHNIKLMLDFFKNQNFQVIFCAPPNKLESIGTECGVIIPVLKISNDNMQIGKVRFHEQQSV